MIGDRSHASSAKKQRHASVGVLYGYGSKDELLGAGASKFCATPQAIPGCISENFPTEPATDSNARTGVTFLKDVV